jgi:hypothetical protein
VAYPGIFFGGVQQIQLRTEGRENGDLGAVAPYSGVPLNLKMSETRILIRLLRIYFPRISEFGLASEFRGGLNPPPVRHWLREVGGSEEFPHNQLIKVVRLSS